MRHEDSNLSLGAVLGLAGAVMLVVVVVALQVVFTGAQQAELEGEGHGRPSEELRLLKAQQQELLASYGVVDQTRGTVRVPVERAMDLLAIDKKKP